MHFFRQLRVGARLSLGFALLIAFGLVGTVIGIERIRSVEARAEQLGTEDSELLVLTQQWGRAIESNIARTWVVFFASDPKVLARVKDEMKDVVTVQNGRLKRLNELVAGDPAALAMVAQISRQREEYQATRNALLKRQEAGESVGHEVVEKFYPLAQAYLASIDKVADYQRERSASHREMAATAASQGVTALVLSSLVALLACDAGATPHPAMAPRHDANVARNLRQDHRRCGDLESAPSLFLHGCGSPRRRPAFSRLFSAAT